MIVRAILKGGKEMPLKKGQKLTDDPRSVRLEIRLTKSEDEMLTDTAKKKQTTKTAVIVEGVRRVRDSLEKE